MKPTNHSESTVTTEKHNDPAAPEKPAARAAHSAEPWEAVELISGAWEARNDHADCSEGIPVPGNMQNVRRVVACVNALAGIPTSALEAGALGDALAAMVAFVATFDAAANMPRSEWTREMMRTEGFVRDALRALGRLP